MAFDKRHYKEMKAFVSAQVGSRPWCYEGSLEDWLKMWIRLIHDRVKEQDYEGAKAIKDSIREFLNNHLDEVDQIAEDTLLKIEES